MPANFGYVLEQVIYVSTLDFPDTELLTTTLFQLADADELDEDSRFTGINIETSVFVINFGSAFYHYILLVLLFALLGFSKLFAGDCIQAVTNYLEKRLKWEPLFSMMLGNEINLAVMAYLSLSKFELSAPGFTLSTLLSF